MNTTRIEIEIALLFGFLLGLINAIFIPFSFVVVPEPYRLVTQAVFGAAVSVALGLKFGFLKSSS